MSYPARIPASEIKEKVTSASVEFAEKFGTYLGQDEFNGFGRNGKPQKSAAKLTTSQLRKFFGEVKRQQMVGYKETDFILLKPKLAYAVGRADKNSKIRDFYEVMAAAIDLVTNETEFQNFIKIFEAIVAYHKVAENS